MTRKIARGSTKFLMAIDQIEQLQSWMAENPNLVGVGFIGRSNVGKSSLINAIFGSSVARTSKTPGRTQKVNVFSFKLEEEGRQIDDKKYILFDLPGYGHAQVSKAMTKNWNMLMGTFFGQLPISIALLLLQDARHPHQPADQQFQEFIKESDFSTYLVFNKIDKLKRQKDRAALKNLQPFIYENYKHVQQIHQVSAETGKGVDQLELAILNHLAQFEESEL